MGSASVRITAIETVRVEEFANLLWLRVHTDDGVSGLGETFMMAATVEAYVHEVVAPKMLGRDPMAIDRIARDLVPYVGFRATGAEIRGNSAFDIALWDLFGKVTGQPIAQLLGGFTRETIRTYNTCAGSDYIRDKPRASGRTITGIGAGDNAPYDDLNGFLNTAGRTRRSRTARGRRHRHEDLAVRHGAAEENRAVSTSLRPT